MGFEKAHEGLRSIIRLMRDSGYECDQAYEGFRLWSVITLMRDSGCRV